MLRVPDNVLTRRVDDDALLLDLDTGRTFLLNPTGALTWSMLVEGVAPQAIVGALADEFDADIDEIRSDVESVVTMLVENGLLRADETDGD